MKKTYLILLSLCLCTTLPSCLSDLDTEPLTESLLLPEQAWEDPASYEEFLAKIYAGLALSGNSGSFGEPDITADDLKFYDDKAGEWKVEPGKFKLYIGSSSADIRQTASFELL